MSFKFRKRIRVAPGCTLNLSKSGISATVGIKGFSVNVGKRGSYLNVGLPGTGIYDRIRVDEPSSSLSRYQREANAPVFEDQQAPQSARIVHTGEIPSDARPNDAPRAPQAPARSRVENPPTYCLAPSKYDPIPAPSASMLTLQRVVTQTQITRFSFQRELRAVLQQLATLYQTRLKNQKNPTALAALDAQIAPLEQRRDFLQARVASCQYIGVAKLSPEATKRFAPVADAFLRLAECCAAWNLVELALPTGGSQEPVRFPIRLEAAPVAYIDPAFAACRLNTAQGDSLALFPPFIALVTRSNFALIDYRDVTALNGSTAIWREDGEIPSDAERLAPNRFCRDALYFQLQIKTIQGVRETFVFSDVEQAQAFYRALVEFRRFCRVGAQVN